MLASYILNPDDKHNLNDLSKKWLSYSPVPITDLIGESKKTQISMRDVAPELIAEYAGEDADLALKLRAVLKEKLESENLIDLARNVEFALVEVLVQMEYNGVAIDTAALKEISDFITIEVTRLRAEIFKESGQEFLIDSPKQLGDILFGTMGIPSVKKTKTGHSTDVNVLTELAENYPIANMVLEYRQLQKLKNTYSEALPKMIHPLTGRVHTTFNQTVASTGRLSSTEPNLQNIPIRSELGRTIRKAFVAQDKDAVILSADYSQIELRIMAYVCGDETLINAFKNNQDIHAATAASLFGVPLDGVDGNMRRMAKTVNFGVMYGIGAFGLARRLGSTRNEASEIIKNYFDKYFKIKQYIDDTIAQADLLGYVTTMLGRRRYFPLMQSRNKGLRQAAERAAINAPIQGTAADMMKLAMINVHRAMQKAKMRSKMTLQVHDELVFEAMNDELEDLRALVKEEMEGAFPLGEVPVLVETGVGRSWFEAH
jgi:DNA polymerase-1